MLTYKNIIKKRFILTVLSILPIQGQGSTFDCNKEITNIEKLICSNNQLSFLDEILNVAYQRALITSINEKKLKKTQQNWLIHRNNCTNENCLNDIYWNQIKWLSQQPRAQMKYELVMSKDDSICNQALKSFNKHINEEYPPPPPTFIQIDYRIHSPVEISPQWKKLGNSSAWITEVDIDWDGKQQTILKDSIIDSGEKASVFFDISDKLLSNFTLDKYNRVIISDIYSLEKSYSSGTFGNPLYDKTYMPYKGVTNITPDKFDVIILKQRPYITFVSIDYLDKIGNTFFEDWSERKWRIISQYYPYENKSSIYGKHSFQNELKDVCYFILIKNTKTIKRYTL
jgi:uncharacterized protein